MQIVVYADESGTHGAGGKEPAPGVYGFIATVEYWEKFCLEWTALLKSYDVPYFHFRELNKSERAKPGNPYHGWDHDFTDDFIHDLAMVATR